MKVFEKPVEVGVRRFCNTQEELDFWTERFRFLSGDGGELPEYERMRDEMVKAILMCNDLLANFRAPLVEYPEGDKKLALAMYEAKRFVDSEDLARFIFDAILSGELQFRVSETALALHD